MFHVYQDSIGSEKFKSFDKAKKYLLDTIKENFSFAEIRGDEDEDYEEIEYDIDIKVICEEKK